MDNVNFISIIIIGIVVIPILTGFLGPFSRDRIEYAMENLVVNIQFILSLILSIFLTRKIFIENPDHQVWEQIQAWIPEGIKAFLGGKDVMTYLVSVPLLMLVVTLLLKLVTEPVYNFVLIPTANALYSGIDACGGYIKRAFGALWQVPRALLLVFVFGLLLNFYTYYFPSPLLSRWMNESKAYQLLYKSAIYPALNSNIAKKVPVIVNDSFKEIGKVLPRYGLEGNPEIPEKLKEQLAKRNIRVIEYFNGVTLEEAIKSTPEIDETAKKIVGNEKSSIKKAQLLYKWVSKSIEYDYEKAEKLGKNPKGISSGAIEAFATRKGVCFDYSCLYIAMCRSAGLKVRLITGLGYSGVSWGDHAWNQVYVTEQNRWINVDTTFGSSANYFDKSNFGVDHRYDEVQGEW